MVSDPYVMLKVDPKLASAARIRSHVPQRPTRCHCTRDRLASPRPCVALRCVGSCIPEVSCAASLRLRTVQRRRATVCSSAADGNTLQKTVLEARIATAENFRPFGQVRARCQLEVALVVGVTCVGNGNACTACHHGAAHQERPCLQLITATDDGKEFDEQDAQLVLDQGAAPRFYIMKLPRRGLTFDRITYHASVTQCLGEVAALASRAVNCKLQRCGRSAGPCAYVQAP